MIDLPIVLALSWLFGRESGRGGETPAPTRPTPVVDEIDHIDAWPRAVPKGGARNITLTGGKDPIAWRRSRYNAARQFLLNDDRSIEALTRLVENGTVEHGDFAIDAIALSVVTHWDIETASGSKEWNYNVGGVLALEGQQHFVSTDVGDTTKPVAFCAYDDLTQGIADYFGVLSYARFESALVALLMLPTNPGWFSELGWAGYYGMDPVQAEQAYAAKRAIVAVDVAVDVSTQ